MSAERFEITDDGASIIITELNGIRSTIDPVDGQHLDDVVIGAIRQQARDIAELRTDLAAAVAERDRLFLAQAGNLETFMRVKLRAEQAESRLAAIEAAPTVAWQWMDTGHFRKNKPDGALVFDWRPLIARPAKD